VPQFGAFLLCEWVFKSKRNLFLIGFLERFLNALGESVQLLLSPVDTLMAHPAASGEKKEQAGKSRPVQI
jgi:hypothetical protein